MKKVIATLAACVVSVAAFGQGAVIFNTHVTSVLIWLTLVFSQLVALLLVLVMLVSSSSSVLVIR